MAVMMIITMTNDGSGREGSCGVGGVGVNEYDGLRWT
jgi:hypothetical protein